MVLLIPVAGAIIGTAWAVSHPVKETVRHGVVVSHASFWHVLLLAVAGGVGGIVVVAGVIVLGAIAYYRLRGDRTWHAHYSGDKDGRATFELRKRPSALPTHVATLGAVECAVKTPRGAILSSEDRTNPVGWFAGPEAFAAYFSMDRENGEYEVRWYVARGRTHLQEVARLKVRSYDAT